MRLKINETEIVAIKLRKRKRDNREKDGQEYATAK